MDCYCWKTMGPEGLSRKTFKIKTQWTRRDLDKNSFESKNCNFGIYYWKYPGYVSREKPSELKMVR
jgi:hypothetical protein